MTWEPISARACISPLKVRPCQMNCLCVWMNEIILWCHLTDLCRYMYDPLFVLFFYGLSHSAWVCVCVYVCARGQFSALLTAVCTVLCSLVNCLFVEQAETYIPSIKPSTQHLCPFCHQEKRKPALECSFICVHIMSLHCSLNISTYLDSRKIKGMVREEKSFIGIVPPIKLFYLCTHIYSTFVYISLF